MRTLIAGILIAISTAAIGQQVPSVFNGATYERLNAEAVVFTENSDDIYSRLKAFDVTTSKKYWRYRLVAETRYVEGVRVTTVIDLKTNDNPLIYKYTHFVGNITDIKKIPVEID
jgi:hypothetical protein